MTEVERIGRERNVGKEEKEEEERMQVRSESPFRWGAASPLVPPPPPLEHAEGRLRRRGIVLYFFVRGRSWCECEIFTDTREVEHRPAPIKRHFPVRLLGPTAASITRSAGRRGPNNSGPNKTRMT